MNTQNDTLHYLKFDKKTGKSRLVIEKLPLGTFRKNSRFYIAKTKSRTKRQKNSRYKNFISKISRMYNYLFK